mgnify:CR=1 FL=1
MAKIFYTDHDIEDLAKQGVDSIELNDDIVLTDLARDKARRLGISVVKKRDAKAQADKPKSVQPKKRIQRKPQFLQKI